VISHLPSVNATLNTLSAVFLALGYYFIRQKNVPAHKKCMLSAFATSSVFLVSYITYHAIHGVVHFTGQGLVRPFYFSLLGTHTVLAAVIVPLVLITLYRAWRGQFDRHRRIARWTLPIWFYVSITGVVVYFMLYHLYAA
jgi:putative membrane protein